MSMFFSHIDEPSHPSTRLAERIHVRAWCVGECDIQDLSYEFILEEVGTDPLRSSSSVVGKVLSVGAPHQREGEGESDLLPSVPFFESLAIIPEESTSGDPAGESAEELASSRLTNLRELQAKKRINIAGILNIASLIPPNDSPPQSFTLTLSLRLGAERSISNSVLFSVLPRNVWSNPYGGFLFPKTAALELDALIIEGWATKQGDLLRDVEIFLNDISLGIAARGFPSLYQHLALPDPEESSHCIFQLPLWRKHVEEKLGTISQPLRLHAVAHFASGADYKFSAGDFTWLAADRSCSFQGAIEEVRLTGEGRLRVAGWVSSGQLEPVRLFLCGVHRCEEICSQPELGNSLSWNSREDVELRHLLRSSNEPAGFQFELNPLLLGRFPGNVRLAALCGDQYLWLGSHGAWQEMGRIVAAQAFHSSFREKSLATVMQVATNFGLCQRGRQTTPRSALYSAQENIIFATHNLSPVEGAPKVLFSVIRSLVEDRRVSGLTVISAKEGLLRSQLEHLGVRVIVLPDVSVVHQTWDRYHAQLKHIGKLWEELQPRAVFANVLDSFWAIDAAARQGIPSLWVIHESVDALQMYPQLDLRLRMQFIHQLQQASAVLFVAEATRKMFLPYLGINSSQVIPNGVDIREISRLQSSLTREQARAQLDVADDEFVVTIIGTTAYRKGQDRFCREMKRLQDEMPETKFRFLVVGARETPFLNELRELVANTQLREIEFVSETPNVAPYYIGSDVIVIASREEAAPLVSLEALAFGVPLVTTDVFGLREQVRHEKTALVFDGDTEGHLGLAIKRLMHDPGLRRALVENGKQSIAERFTLDNVVKQYQNELLRIAPSLRLEHSAGASSHDFVDEEPTPTLDQKRKSA